MNEAVTSGKYGIAVMADLEGAFDSVWREKEIYMLYKAGITNNLLLVLRSFLKHRQYRNIVSTETSSTPTQEIGQTQPLGYRKGQYLAH